MQAFEQRTQSVSGALARRASELCASGRPLHPPRVALALAVVGLVHSAVTCKRARRTPSCQHRCRAAQPRGHPRADRPKVARQVNSGHAVGFEG